MAYSRVLYQPRLELVWIWEQFFTSIWINVIFHILTLLLICWIKQYTQLCRNIYSREMTYNTMINSLLNIAYSMLLYIWKLRGMDNFLLKDGLSIFYRWVLYKWTYHICIVVCNDHLTKMYCSICIFGRVKYHWILEYYWNEGNFEHNFGNIFL